MGPGDDPSSNVSPLLRFPTLPVPADSGSASPDPPPKGVNIGGAEVGKFPWPVQPPCAVGLLDSRGIRWQDAPPCSGGADYSAAFQAGDLPLRANSATIGSL
ncbi:hypothetical protein GCM10010307_24450 [Streptomyces vastus]|uniref:Uncharacterized protein n=1 Tax=Streptomyces vastus TaxID=285451 RepID=A0ABP6CZK5_9ACTN